MMIVFQGKAKILKNNKVGSDYFKIVISLAKIATSAQPGQFVNIRVNDTCQPLLRRPFSIYRVSGASIEIIYEVVGKGTEILSQKRLGEYLDVIGPLGNGFNYQLPITNYQLPILVAGGMGVAPLVFLAEKLKKSQIPNPKSQIIVLIGAKTKGQILCEKEFKKLGCDVRIATDDGSKGLKGKVTELLKKILPLASAQRNETSPEGISDKRLAIYACGPRPMLKEISHISGKYNIPAQISLEEHLACGIGACLGCVVNTKKGYQRVCKEGPVFDAQKIVW